MSVSRSNGRFDKRKLKHSDNCLALLRAGLECGDLGFSAVAGGAISTSGTVRPFTGRFDANFC